MIKNLKKIIAIGSACLVLVLSGCGEEEIAPLDISDNAYEKSTMAENEYDNLCVPTQLNKIGEDYFIVDCYHSQIITSKDVNEPVKNWKVMSDKINMGHTIASDGVVYLCDDTENNRVLVYAKSADDFYLIDTFDGIGKRPHFILYNEKDNTFYVLSSLTGEFYLFKRLKGTYNVELEKKVFIPQLNEVYVRSFSFIDDLIYLPAGNGFIFEIDPKSFEIISFQELPPELGGPTQVYKYGDYYYLTVSTDCFANSEFATIVRTKDLNELINKKYEVLKDKFCDDGTPYVMNRVDDKFYLAWHSDDGKNCMWDFEIDKNNELLNIHRTFE